MTNQSVPLLGSEGARGAGAAFDSIVFRLRPGEQLQWQGRPRQGLLVRAGDYLVTPMTALWAGFALYWEVSVLLRRPVDLLLAVWGIPFVALGLWLLAGRLLYDIVLRANTRYALTDQRVIGIRTAWPQYYKSEGLATLDRVGIERHIRGDATIAFGPPPNYLGPEREYYRRREQQLRFERIAAGDDVLRMIETARAAARRSTQPPQRA